MSDVIVEHHDSILVLRINRPEFKNAVGGTMLADLADAFDMAAQDDSVRVVVTTGQGSAFSVGAYLPELRGTIGQPVHDFMNGTTVGGDKGLPALSSEQRRIERLGVGRWAKRMLALEKPTIAALNGSAAGGGLALAALHDYRIAARNAKITTGFVHVGVGPEMGLSFLLPRIVGHRVAADLLLRGRTLSAEEACSIGLVDHVVEPADVVDRAMELATELSALPPLAVQLTKRIVRQSATATLDQMLEEEYRTQHFLFDQPETRASIERLIAGVLTPREG